MAERFGVVLAIGLTFFGLMLIAAQEIDLGFDFGDDGEEPLVMASESFGEIGGATEDVRTTQFGSFNVGEGLGDIRAYRADRLELRRALFSERSTTFDYNATQPEYAEISFNVLGRDGTGALYVEANGERVFEEPLVSSAEETINISSDFLNTGMNEFKIGTNRGGLLSSTEYVIRDVEMNVRDRRFNDHVDDFRLFQYEVEDFVGANLSFSIPVDGSVVTEPLEIEVNDNQVFRQDPVRSDQTVELTPSNADLSPGLNTVRFSTEADGSYELENAQLAVRYIGTTQGAERSLDFELAEEELSFIQREDTEETVSFNFQALSGNRDIDLTINDYETTITARNGENTEVLPEDIFEEENTVNIQGAGAFVMDDFTLESEVVER